jgi:hypothetical protein
MRILDELSIRAHLLGFTPIDKYIGEGLNKQCLIYLQKEWLKAKGLRHD